MDNSTTIAELKDLVEEFVKERDWEQFHSPKSLSMAIAVEAAELMDLYPVSESGTDPVFELRDRLGA